MCNITGLLLNYFNETKGDFHVGSFTHFIPVFCFGTILGRGSATPTISSIFN